MTRLKTKTLLLLLFCLYNLTLSAETVMPAAPKVDASSYLLIDFNSGEVLVEENSNEQLPPASLTKMMTTYAVSAELKSGRVSLEDDVLVSEKAWRTEGSRMFIEVGKTVKLNDLLHGVIIQSGNDASVALAEHISGTEDGFADLMNEYAARLGMENTHFVNSTGLPDPEHYTTAKDLAILAKAMIRNFPDEYKLYSIKEFTFNKIKQYNRNKLLGRVPGVDGIKTGHTQEAGYCLVTSALKNKMRLISVVMGTDSVDVRTKASQSLLNYGYRFFETHKLYGANEVLASAKIWKANVDNFELGVSRDIYVTVLKGQYKKLVPVVEFDTKIIAPVIKAEEKGKLKIMLNEEVIVSEPLFSLESIPEGSIFSKLKDEIHLLFTK